MIKKFYMESVILVLSNGLTLDHFLPMVEKLREEQIAVEAFLCEEELPERVSALYITDCKKTAGILRKQGLAVLGYRSEETDFSGVEYIMECAEEADALYLDRVYRRYHDISWDILETERCVVRETKEEDVDAFFEIYNHPDIIKYTEKLYPEKEQERAYIREYIDRVYRYFEFGVWTVLWKETGEIIGRAGFSVREGYELPELGFVIGIPWQGKGVAYEICDAILKYGKEEYDFQSVQALVMPQNKASVALCGKLGFTEGERVWEKGNEYLFLKKNF